MWIYWTHFINGIKVLWLLMSSLLSNIHHSILIFTKQEVHSHMLSQQKLYTHAAFVTVLVLFVSARSYTSLRGTRFVAVRVILHKWMQLHHPSLSNLSDMDASCTFMGNAPSTPNPPGPTHVLQGWVMMSTSQMFCPDNLSMRHSWPSCSFQF